VVAACCIWYLVLKLSVLCGAEGYVSGLRAAAAARKPVDGRTDTTKPRVAFRNFANVPKKGLIIPWLGGGG
jgi:hypothetical protein